MKRRTFTPITTLTVALWSLSVCMADQKTFLHYGSAEWAKFTANVSHVQDPQRRIWIGADIEAQALTVITVDDTEDRLIEYRQVVGIEPFMVEDTHSYTFGLTDIREYGLTIEVEDLLTIPMDWDIQGKVYLEPDGNGILRTDARRPWQTPEVPAWDIRFSVATNDNATSGRTASVSTDVALSPEQTGLGLDPKHYVQGRLGAGETFVHVSTDVAESAWSLPVEADGFIFDVMAPRFELDTENLTELYDHPWRAGDADINGRFDQLDLVQMLSAAKYEQPMWAEWQHGDFDLNGRFDRLDIVEALRGGQYMQGPYLATTAGPSAAVASAAVPEPPSMLLAVISVAGMYLILTTGIATPIILKGRRCPCGSGQPTIPREDGYGQFIGECCDECLVDIPGNRQGSDRGRDT